MRYLYLTILLILTGCSTMGTLNPEISGEGCPDPSFVYGGAITDLQLVYYAITDDDDLAGRIALGIYGVIDFPFSAALDTVLLPYTVVRQIAEC